MQLDIEQITQVHRVTLSLLDVEKQKILEIFCFSVSIGRLVVCVESPSRN